VSLDQFVLCTFLFSSVSLFVKPGTEVINLVAHYVVSHEEKCSGVAFGFALELFPGWLRANDTTCSSVNAELVDRLVHRIPTVIPELSGRHVLCE